MPPQTPQQNNFSQQPQPVSPIAPPIVPPQIPPTPPISTLPPPKSHTKLFFILAIVVLLVVGGVWFVKNTSKCGSPLFWISKCIVNDNVDQWEGTYFFDEFEYGPLTPKFIYEIEIIKNSDRYDILYDMNGSHPQKTQRLRAHGILKNNDMEIIFDSYRPNDPDLINGIKNYYPGDVLFTLSNHDQATKKVVWGKIKPQLSNTTGLYWEKSPTYTKFNFENVADSYFRENEESDIPARLTFNIYEETLYFFGETAKGSNTEGLKLNIIGRSHAEYRNDKCHIEFNFNISAPADRVEMGDSDLYVYEYGNCVGGGETFAGTYISSYNLPSSLRSAYTSGYTSDWQTYRNLKYGFEFKYPSYIGTPEDTVGELEKIDCNSDGYEEVSMVYFDHLSVQLACKTAIDANPYRGKKTNIFVAGRVSYSFDYVSPVNYHNRETYIPLNNSDFYLVISTSYKPSGQGPVVSGEDFNKIISSIKFDSQTKETDDGISVPHIDSISPSSGKIGTIVEIKGTNLSGFEGDLDVYFERSDGKKIMLTDTFGSYPKTGGSLIKITVKEPCQQGETIYGRYSGIPSQCNFVALTPGTYKVYTEPWGKKSNEVIFTVTK